MITPCLHPSLRYLQPFRCTAPRLHSLPPLCTHGGYISPPPSTHPYQSRCAAEGGGWDGCIAPPQLHLSCFAAGFGCNSDPLRTIPRCETPLQS